MRFEDHLVGALAAVLAEGGRLRISQVGVRQLDKGAVSGVKYGMLSIRHLGAMHDLNAQVTIVKACPMAQVANDEANLAQAMQHGVHSAVIPVRDEIWGGRNWGKG